MVSSRALAIGARQLVVQLALETKVSSPVRTSSFTPSTTEVNPSSLAGADRSTFLAP